MDEQLHPNYNIGSNYICMPQSELNLVNKKGP